MSCQESDLSFASLLLFLNFLKTSFISPSGESILTVYRIMLICLRPPHIFNNASPRKCSTQDSGKRSTQDSRKRSTQDSRKRSTQDGTLRLFRRSGRWNGRMGEWRPFKFLVREVNFELYDSSTNSADRLKQTETQRYWVYSNTHAETDRRTDL